MEGEIKEIVKEAARILRDYPEMKYFEALKKAKEIYKGEIENENMGND